MLNIIHIEIWEIIFIFLRRNDIYNILITCKQFQILWTVVKQIRFKKKITESMVSTILKKAIHVNKIRFTNILYINKIISKIPQTVQILIFFYTEKELYISHDNPNKLIDEELKHLPKNIKKLKITDYNFISNEGLKHLPQTIQKLSLNGCDYISNEGLKHLPQNIQYLDLSFCSSISNEGLKHLPQNIQYLDLSYCGLISNEGLKYLPRNITFLCLRGNNLISNEGLKSLPQTIIKLYLDSCGNISDNGFKYLPDSIQYLCLNSCVLVSNRGLKHLPRNIKQIDLYNTSVSIEGLQYLDNRYIFYRIFGYYSSLKKI